MENTRLVQIQHAVAVGVKPVGKWILYKHFGMSNPASQRIGPLELFLGCLLRG